METLKENLKKIFLSNKAKTFYWTTLNGFIVIIVGGLADMNWFYAPFLIALLNGITKYINLNYIKQYD